MSNHFDGRRFFNPGGANGQPFWRVPLMLATHREPWPLSVRVTPRVPVARSSDAEVVVTFVGHSTFIIQTADGNLITDPVYAKRAAPYGLGGPRRVRAPGVEFAALPEISVVLLSHNHYDHCDLAAMRALDRRFSPLFITPLGNARLIRGAGARRIEELDWWQESSHAAMRVTLTPAQHFSARTPWDRDRALWGGFFIGVRELRVFFAGDTGYAPHFSEIRERLGSPDLALMPIGAYEPRWFMKDIHMNPDESVRAHIELGARVSVASHFGTFQLTPEAIDAPVIALREAMTSHGISPSAFRVLDPGESLNVHA